MTHEFYFEVGDPLRDYDRIYHEVSIKVYSETEAQEIIQWLKEYDGNLQRIISWLTTEEPVGYWVEFEVDTNEVSRISCMLREGGIKEHPCT